MGNLFYFYQNPHAIYGLVLAQLHTYLVISINWFIHAMEKMPLIIPKFNIALPLFLNALTLRGGDFAFNIGASMGLTATIAPIGGAYPTLFAVLSYFVFRDPLNKKQIAGIIIALTGLVALGFIQ